MRVRRTFRQRTLMDVLLAIPDVWLLLGHDNYANGRVGWYSNLANVWDRIRVKIACKHHSRHPIKHHSKYH